MALPELHPVNEAAVFAHSGQIGATPAAAYARVPFRGKVLKVGVVQSGAVTGGAAGTLFTAVPTAANDVNEDDIISFTPSGATGSATGAFFAVIRRA